MITSTIAAIILIVGILSLLFFVYELSLRGTRHYSGKRLSLFLIIGITLLVTRFSMHNVTVLLDEENHVDYYTFSNKVKYEFSNRDTISIQIERNTIINDTRHNLIVEPIFYKDPRSTSIDLKTAKEVDDRLKENGKIPEGDGGITELLLKDYSKGTVSIKSYSYINLNYSIDYFYNTPPKILKGKEVARRKYWLHN